MSNTFRFKICMTMKDVASECSVNKDGKIILTKFRFLIILFVIKRRDFNIIHFLVLKAKINIV